MYVHLKNENFSRKKGIKFVSKFSIFIHLQKSSKRWRNKKRGCKKTVMNLIWGNERVMMLCMLCMSASHENLHRELNTVTVMRFCRQTKTRRQNKEVAITARRITVRYKCRIFPYDCWVCTYILYIYHRTLLIHIPISLWQIVPIWFLRNFWHLAEAPIDAVLCTDTA